MKKLKHCKKKRIKHLKEAPIKKMKSDMRINLYGGVHPTVNGKDKLGRVLAGKFPLDLFKFHNVV
jgi:hypothetical protein|tara:strand:+ start:4073 stop:4267 length:195 start_codon:yes stop_codon:yes gene_type:complete